MTEVDYKINVGPKPPPPMLVSDDCLLVSNPLTLFKQGRTSYSYQHCMLMIRLYDLAYITATCVSDLCSSVWKDTYGDTVKAVKSFSFTALERVLGRTPSDEDEKDLLIYSFRRAIPIPDKADPLPLLQHIFAEPTISSISDRRLITGLNKFLKPIKGLVEPKLSPRFTNKACLEFGQDSGGFNKGFLFYSQLLPPITDEDVKSNLIVEYPEFNEFIFRKHQDKALMLFFLMFLPSMVRNPRLYYLSIPERGDKQRIPGLAEFGFGFMGNKLGEILRLILPILLPDTFKSKNFKLPKVANWYNSTDASNSTDNPIFRIFRGIAHAILNKISCFRRDSWHEFIDKVIGPHDVIVDPDVLADYRSKFKPRNTPWIPSEKIVQMVSKGNKDASWKGRLITQPPLKAEYSDLYRNGAGIGFEYSYPTDDVKATPEEVWNSFDFDIKSVGTTKSGAHMCYGFVSVLLAVLTNLPYILGPSYPVCVLTTGDDAASGFKRKADIVPINTNERSIGYLVNYLKTIISKYGYVLAERIFKQLGNQLFEIPYYKLKTMYPVNFLDAWRIVPMEFKKIYNIFSKQVQFRIWTLIWFRFRTKYEKLLKAGVPLGGELGLFPESVIKQKSPKYYEACLLGDNWLVYHLYDPLPRNQEVIASLVKKAIEKKEKGCQWIPFTPGLSDPPPNFYLAPLKLTATKLNAELSVALSTAGFKAFKRIPGKPPTVDEIIRRHVGLSGSMSGYFPKEEKEFYSSIPVILRGYAVIPENRRYSKKDIGFPMALVDYGNFLNKYKKSRVEDVVPQIIKNILRYSFFATIVIVHDSVLGRELAYKKGLTLVLRWSPKKYSKGGADVEITTAAKYYSKLGSVFVFTKDRFRRKLRKIKGITLPDNYRQYKP
jgi:hypothetical protein